VLPAPGGHFLGDALIATRGDAPLVMVHVLELDAAQHRHGRGSVEHRAALADADRVVAAVHAAAPGAQWVVLADHGHVGAGGHGDAEDAVRRVRACWSPAPAGVTAPPGAEVHLIDVARWLADALGAPRHALAQGRPLAVAAAHPDRDATLPHPGGVRLAIGLALLAAGVALGLAAARGRVTALWPIAAAIVIVALHGVPTLSQRAPPIVLAVTGALLACIALVVEHRAGTTSTARLVFTSLGLMLGLVLGLAVVTGLPQALAGGVAARVPGWTGLFAAAGPVLAGAMAGTGSFLALRAVPGGSRE
jgi:hypothetical protein